MTKQSRGGNSSIIEYSGGRQRAMNLAMRRQERRWAAKAGPVTISHVSDRKKPQ